LREAANRPPPQKSQIPNPKSQIQKTMPDYIPRPDAQFNDWQVNFTDYLSAILILKSNK
jgi:hypothetical protein